MSALIDCLLLGLLAPRVMAMDTPSFKSAQPSWAKDRAEEMNLSLGFRAVVDVKDSAASSRPASRPI
jgi:hypothetical protein